MCQYGLPERMFPHLSVHPVSVGAGVVLVITLLVALYPPLELRWLRPVEGMKAVQGLR